MPAEQLLRRARQRCAQHRGLTRGICRECYQAEHAETGRWNKLVESVNLPEFTSKLGQDRLVSEEFLGIQCWVREVGLQRSRVANSLLRGVNFRDSHLVR